MDGGRKTCSGRLSYTLSPRLYVRYMSLLGVYLYISCHLYTLPPLSTYPLCLPFTKTPRLTPPSLDIHTRVHIRDVTDSVAPLAFRQDGCGKPSAETRALTSPPACHLAVRSPISPPPRHHLATSRCISPPSRHASLAASSHGELREPTARRGVRGSRP